jgi:hypothetical protein
MCDVKVLFNALVTDVDIPETAIQVEGAREGQSFVLKV